MIVGGAHHQMIRQLSSQSTSNGLLNGPNRLDRQAGRVHQGESAAWDKRVVPAGKLRPAVRKRKDPVFWRLQGICGLV